MLSPDPTSDVYNYGKGGAEPNIYYADASAHLTQSDFGVLFPWVVKRVFAAEEPEKVTQLNTRTILQVMRNTGAEVGSTSREDLEIEKEEGTKDDWKIVGKKGEVRDWSWLDTDVKSLGDVDDEQSIKGATAEPTEAVVDNEVMTQKSGTAERL